MAKYRKKPVVIEAVQWTGENPEELQSFGLEVLYHGLKGKENGWLLIGTLGGGVRARRNDWIIRGIKGEFYPCKPNIFEATYEKVE